MVAMPVSAGSNKRMVGGAVHPDLEPFMPTDDLKNFKISDQVKKAVDGPKRGGSAEAAEALSAGFPALEALVEQSSPDLSGLQERHAALTELSKTGSTKEKQAAKKAVVAYERALDVVDFLLDTKAGIAENALK